MEIFSKLNQKLRPIQTWKQRRSNYKNSTKVKKILTFKVAPRVTTQTRKRRMVIQEVREFSVRNNEI